MPSDDPLCAGCLPPHCWPSVTQSVWLCPEHQAEQDARLEKYGHLFVKRTEREVVNIRPIGRVSYFGREVPEADQ